MKRRYGFVSNSSSTSFCIYGTVIEKDYVKIFKMLKHMNPEEFKKLRTWVEKEWENPIEVLTWMDTIDETDDVPNGIEDFDIGDVLAGVFGDGMCAYQPYGCDGDDIYVGREWCKIKDDETGKEFKKDVENKIKKMIPDAKFNTHEEAWRDG
jgi:hypothetical protein